MKIPRPPRSLTFKDRFMVTELSVKDPDGVCFLNKPLLIFPRHPNGCSSIKEDSNYRVGTVV